MLFLRRGNLGRFRFRGFVVFHVFLERREITTKTALVAARLQCASNPIALQVEPRYYHSKYYNLFAARFD